MADGQHVAVRFQILGLACSFVHFLLRYCLDVNRKRDAPITTLGGPMSVIDVTSAVLMLFSDAPLLSSDGEKFAAIGRLLIGLLISLSVGTRICFSAAMVADDGRLGHQRQPQGPGVPQGDPDASPRCSGCCRPSPRPGSLALLFVNPAAVSLGRVADRRTGVIKYAIYFGLVCTSLPTFTKVSLRAYQHECKGA